MCNQLGMQRQKMKGSVDMDRCKIELKHIYIPVCVRLLNLSIYPLFIYISFLKFVLTLCLVTERNSSNCPGYSVHVCVCKREVCSIQMCIGIYVNLCIPYTSECA